jgi:CHAT domain
VISNPSNLGEKYSLPPADVKLEENTLRDAFSLTPSFAAQEKGQGGEVTFLTPPITLARLEAELRNGYHVLHFIGHGGFSTKQQQAALYFENDDRTARRVIDADFAGVLDRLQAPPQLVVLAACQSATQSLREVFTGLGPRLVQIGLPAVVAMHADVTMLTARQFAATFYRQLATHGTVDLAMNEARSTLIIHGRYDAAVPVLFMRLRDGRLWGEAPRAAPSVPLEPARPIGRSALSKEDRESLERQLKDTRESLRLIEERKAKYVQETDVPLQYLKEEQRLKERAAELERKLSAE